MRELQVFEINEVAGAGFFDRIGAGILGSMALISVGLAKGGVAGGSTGVFWVLVPSLRPSP